MDINRAIQLIVMLCMRFEGVYLLPYLCPAGVPTIGVGCTRYEDGTLVTLKDPAITRERATQLLLFKIKTEFLPAVLKLCPELDTPESVAAITDLCFNIGTGNLKTSTLRKKINARDWDAVPAQIRKWVRAAGKVLKGLVLRREAEIILWLFSRNVRN